MELIESIATVMILVFSICVGLAGAVGMLEVVFSLMTRPVTVGGERTYARPRSVGRSHSL